MPKIKIAISLDNHLLKRIDTKVDKNIIRSRSQAIELFLERGLREDKIDTIFLMLSKNDQESSIQEKDGLTLLKKQIDFFQNNGFTRFFIITQHSNNTNTILNILHSSKMETKLIEVNAKNNGEALMMSKKYFPEKFIVMNGNILFDFDINNMINFHNKEEKLVTIGLMSAKETTRYGTAILKGDLVVDFIEKPKKTQSHIVNAGIYIFTKESLELLDNQKIEISLLPKLAKINQLLGYFIVGDYQYLGRS